MDLRTQNKAALREILKSKRRKPTSAEISAVNDSLVIMSADWSSVIGYWAMGYEIDLRPFYERCLAAGKRLGFPGWEGERYRIFSVTSLDDLAHVDPHGVQVPDKRNPEIMPDPDLHWLVPGLGFDVNGNRLGRGGGHYDRLLADYGGHWVGIACDWQIVAAIDTDVWDKPMACIVTPTATYPGV